MRNFDDDTELDNQNNRMIEVLQQMLEYLGLHPAKSVWNWGFMATTIDHKHQNLNENISGLSCSKG